MTDSKNQNLVKTKILGIGITNEKKEKVLEYIGNYVETAQDSCYIVTPNPEIIVYAATHPEYAKVLENAKIALCDGIGVLGAGVLLGKPLKERFTGVDLVENLCEKVANRPITVGFLGAGPGIAEKASECLRLKYPGLRVVFVGREWNTSDIVVGEEFLKQHHPNNKIKYSPTTNYQLLTIDHIDILFVAFGFPKQEEWMNQHVGKIPVKIMAGIGGALDQIVDPTLRPPRLLGQVGLGWLYRLLRQPWRIKRQMALVRFVVMIFQERFRKN